MPITKEQAAHLNTRINEKTSAVRYRERDEKPLSVVKAEAVVAAWEKSQDDKTAEHLRRVGDARTAAQEAVLSGDWPAALAAVKKFENAKF